MNKELKQVILNYMFEHDKDFQLVNNTTEYFRPYIYDAAGAYLIGGETVAEFIRAAEKLVKA